MAEARLRNAGEAYFKVSILAALVHRVAGRGSLA
jgi:hypothetical protein